MRFWLSSESPPIGFHVFRRLGSNSSKPTPGKQNLPPEFSLASENTGHEQQKKRNYISNRLRHRPKWLRSQPLGVKKGIPDSDTNVPFVLQNGFWNTIIKKGKARTTDVTERAQTTSYTVPVPSKLPVQSILSTFSFPGQMRNILILRTAFTRILLQTANKEHWEVIAILILLFTGQNGATVGPRFTTLNSNARKSNILVLMAQKTLDYTSAFDKNGLQEKTRRLLFRKLFKQYFTPNNPCCNRHKSQFNESLQAKTEFSRASLSSHDDSGCSKIVGVSGSLLSFSTKQKETEGIQKCHEDSTCPKLYLVRGIKDIIENVGDLCYLGNLEKEFDSFLTFASYDRDTNVTDPSILRGLLILRAIAGEKKRNLSNSDLVNFFEFSESNFPKIDEPGKISGTDMGCLQTSGHNTPEVDFTRAVPNVANPQNIEWEDPAWVVACLNFAISNVAPTSANSGTTDKNTITESILVSEAFNNEVNDASLLSNPSSHQNYDNLGLSDQESMVSENVALNVEFGMVYSVSPGSVEALLSNTDLIKSNLIYSNLSPEDFGDDDASWILSPKLDLKVNDVGAEVHEPGFVVSQDQRANFAAMEPVSKNGSTTSSGETIMGDHVTFSDPTFGANLLDFATGEFKQNFKLAKFAFQANEEPCCTPYQREELTIYGVGAAEAEEDFVSTSFNEVELLSEDEEEDFLLGQLVTNDFFDSVDDTEDHKEKCRKELSKTTPLWTKTGLLLLEFEEKMVPVFENQPPAIKLVEFLDDCNSGSGSSELSGIMKVSPLQISGLRSPDPKALLGLEKEMMKIGGPQNTEEVQCLVGIIKNYRRVFIHLINNVVLPCNDKISSLLKDILMAGQNEGEIYSFGSAISNEIEIISESLEDNDDIECAYSQERLKRCHSSLATVNTRFAEMQKSLDTLEAGFLDRLTDISDHITRIRTIRDRILEKYFLFYDPNNALGSFGSQNVHEFTHVNDYKQSTIWYYHIDLEEFQFLLTKDVRAVVSSSGAIGEMILLIQENFAFFKQEMCL